MSDPALISALARSLLAGEATVGSAEARLAGTLGRSWGWLRPLAERDVKAFEGRTRPRQRDVVQFLLSDQDFGRTRARNRGRLAIARWLPEPPRMQPAAAAQSWNVPPIETVGGLAIDWTR